MRAACVHACVRACVRLCVHVCVLVCDIFCKKKKLGAHEMVRLRIKSDDEGTQVLVLAYANRLNINAETKHEMK